MANLTINSGDKVAVKDAIRNGQKTMPVWSKHQGLNIPAFPDDMFVMNRLCEVAEISDLSIEFLNQRDHFNAGKEYISVNDGTKTTFTLTGVGNAYSLYAALKGQNLRTSVGVKMGAQLESAGQLTLVEADENGVIKGATWIPDCTIRFSTIAGVSDGENTLEIEVETTADCWRFGGYAMPVKEVFKDPVGATSNAAAPDGSLAAFTLGDGNNTGLGALTPLAVQFNPDGADNAAKYIMEVRVDGVVQSGYSYVPSTGVLTLASAPADGATLEVWYAIRVGAPRWEAKEYGIGSIVEGSNGTYYTNASAIATSADDPADGSPVAWAAYTGWDVAGSSNPVVPYTDGTRTDMFQSLNKIVSALS